MKLLGRALSLMIAAALAAVGCTLASCAAPATPAAQPSPIPTTVLAAATETAMPTDTDSAFPTPQAAPTSAVRALQIFPDLPLQVIKDTGGGNFIHKTGETLTAFESVSELNIKTLHPRYARVRISLEDWEPRNDDGDSTTQDPSGFKDSGYNHATFLLLKEFQQQELVLSASVWDAPDWMVQNPDAQQQRVIDPAKYDELVESLAAWLVCARDEYGATVSYLSFNESNGGYSLLVNAPAYIEIIQRAAKRFAELGLPTRWYLGDTYNIQSTMAYVVPIWQSKDTRPFLGPLTYHSWDLDAPDRSLEAIASFAKREGLDVWCTEVGWDAELWSQPERLHSYEHAVKLARVYNRAIKLSGATVFNYWQMLGYDYNINDGVKGYPAHAILRQITEAFPPGAQVVETSPNPANFTFTAAKLPGGGFAIHLVNWGKKVVTVEITGMPAGSYYRTRDDAQAVDQEMGTLSASQSKLTLEIAPESVEVLISGE